MLLFAVPLLLLPSPPTPPPSDIALVVVAVVYKQVAQAKVIKLHPNKNPRKGNNKKKIFYKRRKPVLLDNTATTLTAPFFPITPA